MQAQAKEIARHARHAEITAINNIAYGIAQDLAAGERLALPLEPLAKDYAARMERAVEGKDGEVWKADDADAEQDRNNLRDTIGFVTIVVEATKATPDRAKVEDAVAQLDRAAAYFEEVERTKPVNEHDHAALHSVRAHLASARRLLEQQ